MNRLLRDHRLVSQSPSARRRAGCDLLHRARHAHRGAIRSKGCVVRERHEHAQFRCVSWPGDRISVEKMRILFQGSQRPSPRIRDRDDVVPELTQHLGRGYGYGFAIRDEPGHLAFYRLQEPLASNRWSWQLLRDRGRMPRGGSRRCAALAHRVRKSRRHTFTCKRRVSVRSVRRAPA